MSDREETLAVLTGVLAGHDGYWTMYPVESGRLHWRLVCRGCESEIGKGRTPSPGVLGFAGIHRAHVAAVLAASYRKPRTVTPAEAVRIWEDAVGDSGQPPTDDELAAFANAVLHEPAP